jgi:hypothetical protein
VGRPISARRLSTLDRGVLWCRRNPSIAGSAAAIVITLAFAAGFGWSMYGKAKRDLDKANVAEGKAKEAAAKEAEALAEAVQAKKMYQENFALSLETLEKILEIAAKSETMLGPPGGPDGPRGPRPGEPGFGPPEGPRLPPDPERAEARGKEMTDKALMLAQVLAFYEKFAAKNELDPKMKFDAARAYSHVGAIHFAQRNPEKGEAAIRNAVQMLEDLRSVFDDPRRIDNELERIRREDEERRRRGPPR